MKKAVALVLLLACQREVEIYIPGEGLVRVERERVVDEQERILTRSEDFQRTICRCTHPGYCYSLMDDETRYRPNCGGQQACELTHRNEVYEIQYRFADGTEGTSPMQTRRFEQHRRLIGPCS